MVSTSKTEIGLIGKGMVGTQIAKYLGIPKYLTYDPPKGYTSEEAFNADVIFLSVYLHSDGHDPDEAKMINDLLAKCKDGAIVVSKMTTYPRFTESLASVFPNLKLVHNPEFLTEATAFDDFVDPELQVIGATRRVTHDDIDLLLDILPAPDVQVIRTDSTTSELLKLTINGFYAMKNSFFNAIYDVAEESGASYDDIKRAVADAMGVGSIHTQVWHKGGRGFDGKCLPKDFLTLMRSMTGVTDYFQCIEKAAKINEELLKKHPKKDVQPAS